MQGQSRGQKSQLPAEHGGGSPGPPGAVPGHTCRDVVPQRPGCYCPPPPPIPNSEGEAAVRPHPLRLQPRPVHPTACNQHVQLQQVTPALPEGAEGRTSRSGRARALGGSLHRPGSAGQGCRGSAVGRLGRKPAGTEAPATERRRAVNVHPPVEGEASSLPRKPSTPDPTSQAGANPSPACLYTHVLYILVPGPCHLPVTPGDCLAQALFYLIFFGEK